MSELVIPHIEIPTGPLTHNQMMGATLTGVKEGVLGSTERPWLKAADKLITWVVSSFGGTYAAKILDHVFNDGTLSAPGGPTLALGTGAIADSDVAASFGGTTEANYTGYARVLIGASDMGAAAAAAPATKTNSGGAFTFPACSGSTSTVIAWCTCTSATTTRLTAGDIIFFGTCTSTVISTTQTPPTVAISGLSVTLE